MRGFSDRDYEDAAVRLFKNLEVMMDERGEKLHIRSEADLKRALIYLDKHRRDSGRVKSRFSNSFLDRVARTKEAKRHTQTTIGHFGSSRVMNQNLPSNVVEKEKQYQLQGKETYAYDDSVAVSYTRKGKDGPKKGFRDIGSGRFVSKKKIT